MNPDTKQGSDKKSDKLRNLCQCVQSNLSLDYENPSVRTTLPTISRKEKFRNESTTTKRLANAIALARDLELFGRVNLTEDNVFGEYV